MLVKTEFNTQYTLYGNLQNIKYFEIKNNIYTKQTMGSYFIVPLNITNIDEYEENLRKLQYDKKSQYFDINSRYLEYDHLSYFTPTNSFYINITLELSSFLNVNLYNIYTDFQNVKKIALYMKKQDSIYGEYKVQEYFKKNDCNIVIFDSKTKKELLFNSFSYYNIYTENGFSIIKILYDFITNSNTTKSIELWSYKNNTFRFWYDSLLEIQESNGFTTQDEMCLQLYNYQITTNENSQYDGLIDMILNFSISQNNYQIFFYFYTLNINKHKSISLFDDIEEFNYVIIQNNELNKFKENDIVVFISQDSITKLISNKSDLYIFFENIEVKEYDDFSLSQEKFNIHNEITYSNKYFYLKMPIYIWNTYIDMIQSLDIKDNTIHNKLKKFSMFHIASNFPISLIKGTQPNFLYENFKISPFILDKKIVTFGKRKLNENITIDYGKRYKNFKQKDFELQKGIIPYTFVIFIQDQLNKIDYSIFYRSEIYKTKRDKVQQFSMLYDYPISQFSTNEIIDLLYDPKSNTSYSILMNLYKQEEQVVNEYIYYFERVSYKLKQCLNDNQKYLTKNNILLYLKDIGFDMEENHYNVYGFIKTYDSLDDTLSNLVCGLIQYTSNSIFMYYKNTDTSKDTIILNNYQYMYLDFSYYQYINNSDILTHRKYFNIKQNIEVVQQIDLPTQYINAVIAGNLYIDGVKLNENDLVLVTNQKYKKHNGIYKYKNNILEIQSYDYSALLVNVINGQVYHSTQWIYTQDRIFIQNISKKYISQTDNELKDTIYNDYFKYYKIDENVYIPFFSKIHGINKENRYADMDLKLQVYDIPILYFGQLNSNRIFKDFDKNSISYSKIEGSIPLVIKNYIQVNGSIPIYGFYLKNNSIKMLKKISQYIPIKIDTKNLFLSDYLPSSNSDLFSDLGLSDITYEYIINYDYKKFQINTYFNIIKSKYNKYNITYNLYIEQYEERVNRWIFKIITYKTILNKEFYTINNLFSVYKIRISEYQVPNYLNKTYIVENVCTAKTILNKEFYPINNLFSVYHIFNLEYQQSFKTIKEKQKGYNFVNNVIRNLQFESNGIFKLIKQNSIDTLTTNYILFNINFETPFSVYKIFEINTTQLMFNIIKQTTMSNSLTVYLISNIEKIYNTQYNTVLLKVKDIQNQNFKTIKEYAAISYLTYHKLILNKELTYNINNKIIKTNQSEYITNIKLIKNITHSFTSQYELFE